MAKLFLGIFDIIVSLFVWLPFAFVCASSVSLFIRLLRRRFSVKNLLVLTLSLTYIGLFVYLYIYKPDFLAPIFVMLTCLVPVTMSSRKLMRER